MVRLTNAALVIVSLAALTSIHSQVPPETATKNPDCGFKKEVLDPLIDEAERGQFNTLRVEIVGSTYTRDREFRKKMENGMSEGDIFTRAALERSIRNVGKMKQIYPLTLEDVEVRLDRTHRLINLVICVVQKPRLR